MCGVCVCVYVCVRVCMRRLPAWVCVCVCVPIVYLLILYLCTVQLCKGTECGISPKGATRILRRGVA